MRLIEWIAEKLGWWTEYHVAYKSVDGGVITTGSGIYRITPWLSGGSYSILRDQISEENGFDVEKTVITSITKL